MTEPLTITKLIVLYMLDQVDFPLKQSQIFDFILNEKEYTNYFTLMTATSELVDSSLVEISKTHSSTFMSITPSGVETLKYFRSKISDGIKSDIINYFEKNKMEIREEVSVMSNYYRTSAGDYVAELFARENSRDLLNLKIYMPTEDVAEKICEHWKSKSQDIYAYLMENLL